MKNSTASPRLTLIGPRLGVGALGGCTLAFEQLIEVLREIEPSLEMQVIDSGLKARGRGLAQKALAGIRLAASLPRAIARCDVVGLHTTNEQLLLSTAAVLALCRLFGKGLVVRKFGGPSHRVRVCGPQPPGRLYVCLAEWILKQVDALLLETRAAVEEARRAGIENTSWFPNSRKTLAGQPATPRESCSRFVFVGHVSPDKGILELIEACAVLPSGVTVDVYGPMISGIPKLAFHPSKRIRYCGELPPAAVSATLDNYDAFVLPTRHYGEGYPGAAIEALGRGLPVIATRWQALPELIGDSCGVLVACGDVQALRQAMTQLASDSALVRRLSQGALRRARDFDATDWAAAYFGLCTDVYLRGSRMQKSAA